MKSSQAKVLSTLGRFLFAIPFFVFGVLHLMKGPMMAGYVPAYIPGGVFWVYLVGVAFIAASISILIHKMDELATLLLGILLLIFVVTLHIPGLLNAATMQATMGNFLKDTALAGAAFFMSGALRGRK